MAAGYLRNLGPRSGAGTQVTLCNELLVGLYDRPTRKPKITGQDAGRGKALAGPDASAANCLAQTRLECDTAAAAGREREMKIELSRRLVQQLPPELALDTRPVLGYTRPVRGPQPEQKEDSMSPESPTATPTGAELARAWFDHSPFIGMLGMRLLDIDPDEARVELPFRAELATAGDIIHGGVISSLIDTSAALAAWSRHDPAAGSRWGTVGLSTSFLASGRGETLVAAARVSRRGKSICFVRVEVWDADGTQIAEALVTYRLGG